VGGATILLEPLEDHDDPSPLTKCCPELAKHLEISLGVDCHRPLVVVLEPEWYNDAESLTAATLCGILDDFGRPECDCLFVSLRLRLCTVPLVLNLLTHL